MQRACSNCFGTKYPGVIILGCIYLVVVKIVCKLANSLLEGGYAFPLPA